MPNLPSTSPTSPCRVAVIWIDWYAYHVARFEGLLSTPSLAGHVCGIELVGGVGVHAGLKFREDLPAGLPVHTLMPESSWADAGQLRLAIKLWRYLTQLEPDTVLVPGYYTLPAIAAALWARLHRRTSLLMTESTADDHARVAWKERAKGLLIRTLFNAAITGGRAHERYLAQLGFPTDRVGHFYDVVNNTSIAEQVAALRQQPASAFSLPENYFLYVGRLAPEKNIRALFEAWLTYRQTGGSWPLVLVGDGPEAASLRAAVSTSPFARDVHFAGHKGSRELAPFYAFAGCFVLPSSREPWGLVVNEAMAAGLPVIVSNRCGSAEDLVEEGSNGLTFNPSHEGQLVACLRSIGSSSPEALTRMRAHSLRLIAHYSPAGFGLEVARLASIAAPFVQHKSRSNLASSLR